MKTAELIYQSASLIHGDEIPANGATIEDINKDLFSAFYEKQYDEILAEQELPLNQIIENIKNGIQILETPFWHRL